MTQLRGLLPNPPPLKPSVPHPEIGSQARSSLLYSCSSRIILACYVQQCKMLMFQKYPSENVVSLRACSTTAMRMPFKHRRGLDVERGETYLPTMTR